MSLIVLTVLIIGDFDKTIYEIVHMTKISKDLHIPLL